MSKALPAAVPERRRHTTGSAKARRRAARLAAVQALYQLWVTDGDVDQVDQVIAEFEHHRFTEDIDGERFVTADRELFALIVRGAAARRDELDRRVGAAWSAGVSLERVELLLRVILRAGAFELVAHTETAPGILINEYVEVTHAFYGAREPAMVNGVLDHLARLVRPAEGRAPVDDPVRLAR